MNNTTKAFVKKITRHFGSQIQNFPRKRKKRAKKLFSSGMENLHPWQLQHMVEVTRFPKIIEVPVGLGKN